MWNIIKGIIGTKNEREIKRIRPQVDEINQWEDEFKGLTDDQLRARTEKFKQRITEATAALQKEFADLREDGAAADVERRDEIKTQSDELDKQLREAEAEVLQEILPEAFAAVREASERIARFDLAVCHDLLGHRAEALRAYERFVHRFPNPRAPEAYFRMGVVSRAMGRLENAAAHFCRVWQAEATAPVFRAASIYQSGLCLESLHRSDEARHTYALAKSLEPRQDPCRLASLHRLALLLRDDEPLQALEIYRDLAAHSANPVERGLAQQELLDLQSEAIMAAVN